MAWLIVARMVTGFGSGMSVGTQAFFATQTPLAERTEYMGYNQVISRLVTPSGPAFNLLFVFLPQFSVWGIKTPEESPMFSQYTYVGWFICAANLGLIVLFNKRFIEPPRPGMHPSIFLPREFSEPSGEILRRFLVGLIIKWVFRCGTGVGIISGEKPKLPSARWVWNHLRRTKAWVSYVL